MQYIYVTWEDGIKACLNLNYVISIHPSEYNCRIVYGGQGNWKSVIVKESFGDIISKIDDSNRFSK